MSRFGLSMFFVSLLILKADAQWTEMKFPTEYAYSFAVQDSIMYTGTTNGVWVSSDKGTHWGLVNGGLEGKTPWALVFEGSKIFVGTANGIYDMNRDSSWARIDTGQLAAEIVCLGASPTELYVGLYGGGIYLSTDMGSTWKARNSGLTDFLVRTIIVTDSVVYVGTNFHGVFLSTDHGANWHQTKLGYYDVRGIALNDSFLFAATNSGVWRSSDQGEHWQCVINGLPDTTYSYELALAAIGPNIFVSTIECYVFCSTDNGLDWVNTDLGSPIWNGNSMVVSDSVVYVAADSGVWHRPVSQMITSIADRRMTTQFDFQLAQNYPNPWNPTSTISYSLPQKSFVTLKLYDLLGREVRTIVNGEQEPGNYSRIVDANGLTSGVYFYRLQAGTFTDIKKMLLIK